MNSRCIKRFLFFSVLFSGLSFFVANIVLLTPAGYTNSIVIYTNPDYFQGYNYISLSRNRTIHLETSVKCNPTILGVSESEDAKYFPNVFTYQNCSELNPGQLSIINNSLEFPCNDSALFIFGGNTSEEVFGNFPRKFEWEPIENFQSHLHTEWIIGKCQNRTLAYLRNLYNDTSAKRAKLLTAQLSKIHKTPSHRPLTVLLIVLDSVSRQSFFRNLNQTTVFLNNRFASGEYSQHFYLFDFLLNNVQGERTVNNIGPIVYGRTFEHLSDLFNERSIFYQEDWPYFASFQEESIWKHYERHGFVTLFSFDSYIDYVSHLTGRKIYTDHVNTNFWSAANKSCGYIDLHDNRQCIGGANSHTYSLNYVKEFVKNYEGVNRFAYAHLDVAHETTGNRLKIADRDIKEFMAEIIEYFIRRPEEDIVLMLCADHGRMNTVNSKEAWQEKLLPFHLVFTNKQLVHRTKALENLSHNSRRLVSRFDWHVTLKHLALIPYKNLERHELKELSEITGEHKGISLFAEKISNARDCFAVKIPGSYCACNNNRHVINEPSQALMLEKLVNEGIKGINNFMTRNKLWFYCSNITLERLESAYEIYTSSKSQFAKKNYYVTIGAANSSDFKLELHARLAEKRDINYIENTYGLRPKIEEIMYTQKGVKKLMASQVTYIGSPNKNHSCPYLPVKYKEFEKICNCPKNSVNLKYRLYFNNNRYSNCYRFCEKKLSLCVDFSEIKNNLDEFSKTIMSKVDNIQRIHSASVFGIIGNTLYIPNKDYCYTSNKYTQLICICLTQV